MCFGYSSKKVALIIGSIIVLLGFFFYLGTLIADDTICIARTNVAPEEELFSDINHFIGQVENLQEAVLATMVRQFDTDTGFFVYSEHPNGEISASNNDIRQLLASRVLAEKSNKDDALKGPHVQNVRSILNSWYQEEEGIGFVYWDQKSKLGGNAMLLRTLVVSPFFQIYREEADALVRGILAQQTDDGSLRAWFKEPDYEYDEEYLLTFYSGEAILALLEYAEKTDNEAIFEAARMSQEYYLEKYVTEIDVNYYPAYVPWHTQSLVHFYEKAGDEKYAEAIFILNDRLLALQDREEYMGRFFNPDTPEYGSPHAASDAVYTEGLAFAYTIAREVGDNERQQRYYEALVYGVHNLKELQFNTGFWSLFGSGVASQKLSGGITTNTCSSWIRIDTQAHTVDALTKINAL